MPEMKGLKEYADLVNSEFAKYRVQMILAPEKIQRDDLVLKALTWNSVKFNDDASITQVPDDKRGIYAFAVSHASAVLPPHGYIFYIGIVGYHDSERSLRDRYKEYLNEKKVMKRAHIAWMIGNWEPVLKFFYAPIADDVPSATLETLEKQLNSALLPPFAKNDLEADTKKKVGAFK